MHKICFTTRFFSCLYMFRAPCAHRQEVKIVGQTNRNLKSIFRYIKNNDPRSAYALHILTADMNMVSLTTLWLFSSRSTHHHSCFHMNKCTSNRSTVIMNSSTNNIWTSIILCLTSFIQILHFITHLTPNP